MDIIYNSKVNKLIKDFNEEYPVKKKCYKNLVNEMITTLVFGQVNDDFKRIERIRDQIEKQNLLGCLRQWLILEGIYTVPLDNIIGVLIEDEIRTEEDRGYSGFAFQHDLSFYVFFIEDVDMERTISILVHEIIHVEMEEVWKKLEKQRKIEISEPLQEEIVILLEHLFEIEEMGIIPADLDVKKTKSFQKILQHGIEKSIMLWMDNREDESIGGE